MNITEPEVYGEPESVSLDAIAAKEREERIARLLQWLAHGGNVRRSGERAQTLAHIVGKGPFKTDAALASKLKISAGRISQLRKEIEAFLPGVNGNRRQKLKVRRKIGTKII